VWSSAAQAFVSECPALRSIVYINQLV